MKKLDKKTRHVMLLTSHASQGGTLDYLTVLKKGFLKADFDVEIVAIYRGENSDPETPVKILLNATHLNPITLAWSILLFLFLCLRRRPCAILGVMPLANLLAAIGSRFTLGRSISTHHSPYATQNTLLRIIDKAFGYLGMYDAIICVSNAVFESFKFHPASYRSRLATILNGISIMQPNKSDATTKKQFSISQNLPFAFIAGRLSEQKNVLNAIEGLENIKNIQVAIAGDGPLKLQVQALIRSKGMENRVKLLGNIAKQDVINLMNACAVFVQVSHYEGNSLALLEAISSSAILVVSNVSSQIETVQLENGELGALTCNPTDPTSIEKAISSAVFDSQVRETLLERVNLLKAKLTTEDEMTVNYLLLVNKLATKFR